MGDYTDEGHSYARNYVEELGNFPSPDPIFKLMATLRPGAGVPIGFRASNNPSVHMRSKQRPCPSGNTGVSSMISGWFVCGIIGAMIGIFCVRRELSLWQSTAMAVFVSGPLGAMVFTLCKLAGLP